MLRTCALWWFVSFGRTKAWIEERASFTSSYETESYEYDPELVLDGGTKEPQRFGTISNGIPVLMWHGMGDTCCDPRGCYGLEEIVSKRTKSIVRSVMIGSTMEQDKEGGFIGQVKEQVESVCHMVSEDPVLNDTRGFHALGFSQGGQFLRYLVETCPHAKVRTLVTLGGQHGGVSAPPGCDSSGVEVSSRLEQDPTRMGSTNLCQWADRLVRYGAYLPYVRDHVVQAQYFRDPKRIAEYLEKNPFLPDANNERDVKNPLYAERMKQLERFVMVRFLNDTTVVPRDSSWFATEDEDGQVIMYRDTQAYQEDWIGLRTLDEEGKLVFTEVEGRHLQFTREWFAEEIVEKYLVDRSADQ